MSRHLIYHVFPLAATDVWEWNVEQLIPRLPLFDGIRACAIVTQNTRIPYTGKARSPDLFRVPPITVDPERVMERLRPHGFKFIVMKNDPNLQEVKTLYPLLKCVKPFQTANDFTLYAHAKGVTRPRNSPALKWVRMQYETYLDYWPVVRDVLTRAPVAGSFLRWGPGWQGWTDISGTYHPADSASQWHFSGSWFWFGNACLFSQPDWWKVDRFWSGIEPYPSLHFDASMAGCIFHENGPEMNMYNGTYLQKVEDELVEWKAENAGRRTDLSFPEAWSPVI